MGTVITKQKLPKVAITSVITENLIVFCVEACYDNKYISMC